MEIMVEKKKKKIMVAIDESECSRYALEWTLKNLRDSFEDSKVLLFTVQHLSEATYFYSSPFGYAIPADRDFVRIIYEKKKKLAMALLEEANDICSKYGVIGEGFTKVGEPQEAICEVVEKLHIDLLVVGSHGRKALKRAFLGSVSNYCVNHAKCPVLVVKCETKE